MLEARDPHPRRRHDPLRRRQPKRAVERVRPLRLRPVRERARTRPRPNRHRSGAGPHVAGCTARRRSRYSVVGHLSGRDAVLPWSTSATTRRARRRSPTPTASTNNGAAGANGNNLTALRGRAGHVRVRRKANGFRAHPLPALRSSAGQSLTFALPFVRNWASSSSGATAQPGVARGPSSETSSTTRRRRTAETALNQPKVEHDESVDHRQPRRHDAASVREVEGQRDAARRGGNRFTALPQLRDLDL